MEAGIIISDWLPGSDVAKSCCASFHKPGGITHSGLAAFNGPARFRSKNSWAVQLKNSCVCATNTSRNRKWSKRKCRDIKVREWEHLRVSEGIPPCLRRSSGGYLGAQVEENEEALEHKAWWGGKQAVASPPACTHWIPLFTEFFNGPHISMCLASSSTRPVERYPTTT